MNLHCFFLYNYPICTLAVGHAAATWPVLALDLLYPASCSGPPCALLQLKFPAVFSELQGTTLGVGWGAEAQREAEWEIYWCHFYLSYIFKFYLRLQ